MRTDAQPARPQPAFNSGPSICRVGRTQKGILLHLLLAALKPALDGVEFLLREGTLHDAHAHLFLQFNATVDARSPLFWATACNLRSAGPQALVPRCLQAVAGKVAAAGKAVALLHTHERLYGRAGNETIDLAALEPLQPPESSCLNTACVSLASCRSSLACRAQAPTIGTLTQARTAEWSRRWTPPC